MEQALEKEKGEGNAGIYFPAGEGSPRAVREKNVVLRGDKGARSTEGKYSRSGKKRGRKKAISVGESPRKPRVSDTGEN